MSTATRVPLDEARGIAGELLALLMPACHRGVIAGSIRRGRPDIGDVDLLCEPIIRPLVDMFGDPTGHHVDDLHERCNGLAERGVIEKRLDVNGRAAWGRQWKRAIYRGLSVDIQAISDHDAWGFWLLVMTGPADFNKAIVTPRHQGGLLPPGLEVKDSFRLYRAGGRIPTPAEDAVFAALGLPYLEPRDRSASAAFAGAARPGSGGRS